MCTHYTRASCVRFRGVVEYRNLLGGRQLVHVSKDNGEDCGGVIKVYIHAMSVMTDGVGGGCLPDGRVEVGTIFCDKCDPEPCLNGRPIFRSQLVIMNKKTPLDEMISPNLSFATDIPKETEATCHHGRA